jgi:hypothetical protein
VDSQASAVRTIIPLARKRTHSKINAVSQECLASETWRRWSRYRCSSSSAHRAQRWGQKRKHRGHVTIAEASFGDALSVGTQLEPGARQDEYPNDAQDHRCDTTPRPFQSGAIDADGAEKQPGSRLHPTHGLGLQAYSVYVTYL